MARNFIDRCFEAVAPVHAVRRSAARTALQFLNSGYGNYGANLTKKSMRGWEYHGGSSKEDIEDNIDVLRQRSRDAYMGVPVAASALKTLRTNVVAGGLMPAPQIDGAFLGLAAEQTEELQEKIIREFSLWADTPECDMDGLGNFYKLQQLAYLGYLMNGDAFAALPMCEQVGQPYGLRVRVMEADRYAARTATTGWLRARCEAMRSTTSYRAWRPMRRAAWWPTGCATGIPFPTPPCWAAAWNGRAWRHAAS